MILDLTENVRARIDWRVILRFADWQSDDGGHDERDVEEDAGGLDLGHDSSEEDGDEAVCEDCGYVRPVDDWPRGGPIAVAGDGDHGQEHVGEAIWRMLLVLNWFYGLCRLAVDGADASHESEGIAIPNQETQWVLPALVAVVMGPEVKTAGRRHGRCHISLSSIDQYSSRYKQV